MVVLFGVQDASQQGPKHRRVGQPENYKLKNLEILLTDTLAEEILTFSQP